jgi:hypothetical protein
MAYWIFKVSRQEHYPDVPGERYVYDNTHSVRVRASDTFLYLDKNRGYSFTGTGAVRRMSERSPTQTEAARSEAVRTVYTAHIADMIWFTRPLSISPTTKAGRQNRALLGISDVNLMGWSQSIPAINEAMYDAILGLAEMLNLVAPSNGPDYSVPDVWVTTKVRPAIRGFTVPVLARSNNTCVVCGSRLPGMVEAAHLSPYATDPANRANPANGVCLCRFCHRALDLRLIAFRPSGELLVSPIVRDEMALHHFSRVSTAQRVAWLPGVSAQFLELTVRWYNDNLSNNGPNRTVAPRRCRATSG